MKLRQIFYLIREGLRNTWQNRLMALASVGVLICCLMLTGFAYLIYVNVEQMFHHAIEQNVVAVFLDKDLTDAQVEKVGINLMDGRIADTAERIRTAEPESVFVSTDYVDLADVNTVRQCLSRLEQAGELQRIMRGVYYRPAFSQLLGEYEAPSPHHVALALARGQQLLGGRGAIRVHGGGFAGTVQAYVPHDLLEQFRGGMEALLGEGTCHVIRIRPQGGAVIAK